MQIIVKNYFTGKNFCYEVEPDDRIDILKVKMNDKEGMVFPPCQFRVLYAGKQLDETQTFGYYNITSGAELRVLGRLGHYCKKCRPSGDIHVKTTDGRVFPLEVRLWEDSVKKVKEKIEQKEGIPADQQELFFMGKFYSLGYPCEEHQLLDDRFCLNKTLPDCDIYYDSMILVSRRKKTPFETLAEIISSIFTL